MSLSRPVPVPISEPTSKFEAEDLPKILAALHTAYNSKTKSTVKVEFAENGGVTDIALETKKKFK